MAGYILAQLEVASATLYHRYRETLGSLVDRMGGRVLIDGGALEVLKGDSKPVRFLLIEFPSRESARLFYHLPEHEPIRSLRDQATEGTLWLLDGVDGV
jgi:uncharacterized protein (DUF1330 family)